MIFPTVRGQDCKGRSLFLPDGFTGEFNVALIAFQRYQQEALETWLPYLETLSEQNQELRLYILPTIQQLDEYQAQFFDLGLKFRQDSLLDQRRFTLYVDLNDFNRALDIPTVNRIYVLLLDRIGNVLWRADGVFTPEKARALDETLPRETAHPHRLGALFFSWLLH